ncbi:MAG: hypothetical protein AMXMBFR33_65370 [Candidatus Xenobia bacterium]
MDERPLDSLDLLAQLVRDPGGEAVRTLAEAGTDTAWLLEQLDGRLLGERPRGVSDELRSVIEKALIVSKDFHHTSVDWMHVLMSMLLLGSASVAYLTEAGADRGHLEAILRQRLQTRRKEVN